MQTVVFVCFTENNIFVFFLFQIDDLSREVGKLKDALNSLSQLSYTASPASKRLQQNQQNQQMELLQQQIKQLQYQLAVSRRFWAGSFVGTRLMRKAFFD